MATTSYKVTGPGVQTPETYLSKAAALARAAELDQPGETVQTQVSMYVVDGTHRSTTRIYPTVGECRTI